MTDYEQSHRRRTTLGPYDVIDRIAHGGMGAVMRARHRGTGAIHAVKVILAHRLGGESAQRAVARFRREVEVLARVSEHPDVVTVHAFGVEDGAPWYAMDLVEGRALSDILEKEGPLPVEDAARVVVRVARALDYVHRYGVLHRDIKPDNVMIEPAGSGSDEVGGRARIVDFGLAYDVIGETITRTGEMIGTPAYMSPEQVRGSSADEIGREADVYSLGAVLYAALTGEGPFGDRGNLQTVLVAVLNQVPAPPSSLRREVPIELDAICLKALHKEPQRRYATAVELADDIERWLAGDAVLAQPTGRLGRAARRVVRRLRRDRALQGAGALLAVTVVVVAALAGTALTGVLGGGAESAGGPVVEANARAFSAAFELALAGDASALARAVELAARPESRRALSDEDVALVEILGEIALGEPAAARLALDRLDVGVRARRIDRRGLARLLLGVGRSELLARLVERAPELLDDTELVAAIAAAAVARELDLPGEGALAPVELAAAQERGVRGASVEERRAAADVRVALLGGALGRTAMTTPEEIRAATPTLMGLARALRAGRPRPALDEDALSAVLALAEHGGAPIPVVIAALEVGILALDLDDPRVEPVVSHLYRILLQSKRLASEDEERELAAVSLALARAGLWPFWVEELVPAGSERGWVEPRLAELRDRPDEADPAELVGLTAHLFAVELQRQLDRQRAATPDGVEDRSAAVIETAFVHVRPLVRLLERHRRRGDVPAWGVGWAVWRLRGLFRPSAPAERQRRALERLREAVESEDEAHTILLGLLDEVIGVERARPIERRSFLAITRMLEELEEEGRGQVALAVELTAAALEICEAKRGPGIGRLVDEARAQRESLLTSTSYVLRRMAAHEAATPATPELGECPGEELAGLLALVRRIDPTAPEAYEVAAVHAWRHGDDAEAERLLVERARVRPGVPLPSMTFVFAARVLIEIDRFDLAEELLDRAAPDPIAERYVSELREWLAAERAQREPSGDDGEGPR